MELTMIDTEAANQIERARELYQELVDETRNRLFELSVHPRILNLTVELLAKNRAILDHAAHRVFEIKAEPKLTANDTKKARVYFPIADDLQSFRSTLGRAKLLTLESDAPATYLIIYNRVVVQLCK
jgi:hypothetical protein